MRTSRILRRALLLLGGACWLTLGGACPGAEKLLDFAVMPPGTPPADFRAALTGEGGPATWKIVDVEAASAIPPLTDLAPKNTRERVLAQLSEDPTDERFPLLIYETEEFADFTATLRFRTERGKVEQMAGLAFRLQDERNYYVIRASSRFNNLRFYKFVNGVRSAPIGPEIRIPTGEWHTLEIECKGNSIRTRLNGAEGIPPLTDTSFARGRVALWTKSDAVSYFSSLRLQYDLLKSLPERLVDAARQRYPRLLGVTVYAREDGAIRAVAASDATQAGSEGGEAERRALNEGTISAGATRQYSETVFPLRDRNGDPVYALRLRMRTFTGQTDSNVAARAQPIVAHLQGLVQAADVSAK